MFGGEVSCLVDWSITHHLNTFLVHRDGLEDVVSGYERIGEWLFLAAVVLLLLAGRAQRRAAVAAGAAAALALAAGQVISRLVDRPRPFSAHPHLVQLFAPHAADAGFPSDHATGAFAIAAAVWAHDRRWGAALTALAILLAVGRVAIGVHYPSDVIAGAALGIAAALLVTRGPARRWLDRLADRLPSLRRTRDPASA
jgi:undecaprenyl-diphosphatase